jgi:hypothetical protein
MGIMKWFIDLLIGVIVFWIIEYVMNILITGTSMGDKLLVIIVPIAIAIALMILAFRLIMKSGGSGGK